MRVCPEVIIRHNFSLASSIEPPPPVATFHTSSHAHRKGAE
jgi:hypothetical protein